MAEQPEPAQPLLYNARTRKPETVQADQLEDAIISGTHSYPSGTQINIVDPSGAASSVDSEQLPLAVKQGYKIESPEQYAVRKYVEKNDNAAGAIKAFGYSFLNEAGMGVPGMILDKTQDPIKVAQRQALAKQNEILSGAGAVGGFVASLPLMGPLFKGAGIAGKAAGTAIKEQVAKQLIEQGVTTGAKKAAAEITANAAAKAAQLGTEGAIISAPHAVTEAMLGDPEQGAETLLLGGAIGLGLGLGHGAFGGALKQVQKAASRKVAAKEVDALQRAGEEVPEHLEKLVSGDHVASMRELFESTLKKQKLNAPETIKAAEELGVPLFTGVTEASPLIQGSADTLRKRPTLAGVSWQNETQKTYDALNNVAEQLVGKGEAAERELVTRAQAGQLAKDEITKDIGGRLDYFNKGFDSIGERTGHMPISPEATEKAVKAIRGMDVFKNDLLKSSRGEAEDLLSQLSKTEDVSHLGKSLSIVSEKARSAARAGDYTSERFWNSAKKEMLAIEEGSISEGTSAMGMRGKEGKAAADLLTSERKAIRGEYAEFKDFLKEFQQDFKLGRGSDHRKLLEHMSTMDPAALAKKFFAPSNAKSLLSLKEKAPGAFEALKGVFLQDAKAASMRDGRYNLGSLVRRLDHLEPEVQKIILGAEGAAKLQNLKRVVEALPPSLNPSGTSYAQAFGRMFTPQGLVDNVNDAITYAALKSKDRVAGLLHVEQSMKRMAEKLDGIPEILDGASKPKSGFGGKKWGRANGEQAAIAGLLRLFDDHDEKPKTKRDAYKKAAKAIQDSTADPESHVEKSGTLVRAIQETGAPQIGEQFGSKMSIALQYLNQQLPKPIGPTGILNKQAFEPSDAQIAQFERKLSVIMDPTVTLSALKQGTLTADHMQAMQAVYPKIYQQMQKRTFNWMTKQTKPVSYQMRMRLSLFMGMPLDSSLTQEGIMGLQQSFAGMGDPNEKPPGLGEADLGAAYADQSSTEMQELDQRNNSA